MLWIKKALNWQFLQTNGTSADWATVDTTQGDTAYGWGDHALAGYLLKSGGTMTGTLKLKQLAVSASTTNTTLDFSASNDFKVTLSSDTDFTFSNAAAGQQGVIYLIQDATGGRVFTLPANAKTPLNGASIAQVTTAGTVSILSYTVLDSNNVLINYVGDFA